MPRNNLQKSSLAKMESNGSQDHTTNTKSHVNHFAPQYVDGCLNNKENNKNNFNGFCGANIMNGTYNGFNESPQFQCSQQIQQMQQLGQLNNGLLIQYIGLIIEKQNFALSRFDHIDNTLLKLAKENSELKETIKFLEKKMQEGMEQLTDCVNINTYNQHNFNENNEGEIYNDDNNDDYKSCGDPDCQNCYPENNDYNDGYNSNDNYDELGGDEMFDFGQYNDQNEQQKSQKKKKSKKNNNFPQENDIIMKVEGDFPPGVNPLQMLMEQLTGVSQKKEIKEDDTNSDDGYDQNAPIYESSDENKEVDSNFIELSDAITNITDLIVLGEKYKDVIDLSLKKKEKKNKKKSKYLKSKYDTNDIVKTDENNKLEKKTEQSAFYELDGKKYPVNLEIISKLSAPLKRLTKMIGMDRVKEDIFDMIIYYLQGFEKNNSNMLHSVIEGPPGVGKTKLGKILASVYCGLGIIPSNRFKYVKATDLIGDHVGATKHMTQSVIDEADGGVLFIDEAYALSSNDNKDPYGKECIDTINFNLSENKKKLIVIIAGYPDHLDKYFFSFNPGLARRFPFKFRIDAYTPEELKEIFIDKLRKFGWKFSQSVAMDKLSLFFKTNEKEFPNFGGDVENFFKSCQFAHSKRMIGKNPNQRKKLNFDDIKIGLEKFKKNKRNDETKPQFWKDMFI